MASPVLIQNLLTKPHGASLHLRNEETKPRNNLGSIINTELFSSMLLQQHGLHLGAGKTQTSSNSHSIPAAPCSCLYQLSLPYTNKSPAFPSDFLPGLFKDALSDARWYYSKGGRHRFFCFQETPYY